MAKVEIELRQMFLIIPRDLSVGNSIEESYTSKEVPSASSSHITLL